METHEHAGLADRRRLLRRDRGAHVLGPETTPRHRRRLLLGEPPPRLVRRGRVDLRVQHRLRASRGPGRRRSDERRGPGALRAARLVSARAGLGHGAVLRTHHGVHDARVPRAALLPRGALSALDHLARGVRADQARRRHLRRRRRVRRAAPRAAHRGVQQLLDRIGGGRAPDRALHGTGRDAGRGVHRRPANDIAGDGLRAAHHLRLEGARWLARAACCPRSGHVQLVEAARSPRVDRHVGRGQGAHADRVVLQRQLPVARHAVLRADHRPVVLDHGPVHRAARAGGAGRARGAAGIDLRRVLEAAPGIHFHHPRHDRTRPGEDRPGARSRDDGGPRRPRDPQRGAGGLPPHGHDGDARGDSWDGGRRTVGGPDELAGGSVQRLLHAVHDRLLSAPETAIQSARAGPRRAPGDRSDGAHQLVVDPRDPGLEGVVRLSPGRTGLSGAADLRRVLSRRDVQAFERERLPCRLDRRFPARGLPARRRYAGESRHGGLRPGISDRLVPLDREQHLLSVLQPVHLRRLVSHDDRRELRDDSARGGAGYKPDVRHGHGGKPRKVAGELEPVGRDQLRRRARAYPARLSVLYGVRRRTMTLSRRSALKLGLGAGALEVLGRPVLLGAEPVATARVLDTAVVKARPLPLSAVRLTGGPLKHAQELSARYLLQLEPDRMLAYYRKRAGLEPKAEPYGGWDGDGRNLTGHIAGHHLSGVSLMWAATGDARFKERADYIVRELKTVQDAHGDGYLSALAGGRKAFGDLARGEIRSAAFDLNGEWSPWYTLHKTYAGLRDAYRHTGNQTALDVETRFATWAEKILAGLDDAQLQHMMNTEFGGMNEVLADLYADTGDQRWLALSYKFEHRAFIESLRRHEDDLAGTHGNTQVPKLIGSAARYVYAGRPEDLLASSFFWD